MELAHGIAMERAMEVPWCHGTPYGIDMVLPWRMHGIAMGGHGVTMGGHGVAMGYHGTAMIAHGIAMAGYATVMATAMP